MHDHHQGRRLVEVLQPSGEELPTCLARGGQDYGALHVQQVVFHRGIIIIIIIMSIIISIVVIMELSYKIHIAQVAFASHKSYSLDKQRQTIKYLV